MANSPAPVVVVSDFAQYVGNHFNFELELRENKAEGRVKSLLHWIKMAESGNCRICELNKSKYSCPKCGLAYCSVTCYQSEAHLQCSERFYEEWVNEELRDCQGGSEAKKRMLEILKNQQESNSEDSLDSDDEDSVPDLSSRLQDIDLDDEEAVWEKLSSKERQEFKKLVATGDILKMVPEWEPWWNKAGRKRLITDSDDNLNQYFEVRTICPEISSDIPDFSKLTKKSPSPELKHMFVNILLSYIYTVRLFKGIHKELPVKAMSVCIALSATLRSNEVFSNAVEAYAAFESDLHTLLNKCGWMRTRNIIAKETILEDLTDILQGSFEHDTCFFSKCAISDLQSLCLLTLNILRKNKTIHLEYYSRYSDVDVLYRASRKMTYYLSWMENCSKCSRYCFEKEIGDCLKSAV